TRRAKCAGSSRRETSSCRGARSPQSTDAPSGRRWGSEARPGSCDGWSVHAVAQVDTSPVQADFALRAGARIEGIVTDGATRRPIAGAVISLEGRRAVAPNLPVAPLSPEAETGADGRFTLEQVPPDAMSLYAQKE